jgi:hypothetical protein
MVVMSVLTVVLGMTLQITAPYPGVHAAQVAELRSYVREPYFRYYCLAVNHGEMPGPTSRDALFKSTRLRPDPPTGLIAELQDAKHRIVPASACEADVVGDIRHSATKAKPTLLVVVGPVAVISAERVRFMVFTTSGSLSETDTLVEYRLTPGGWGQVSSTILRQA